MKNINETINSGISDLEGTIKGLESSIEEVKRKFDQLYDDKYEGLLSDKKFKELSARCERQQEELEVQLQAILKKKNASNCRNQGVEKFEKLIEQYDTVSKLDSDILNNLITSIVVSDRIKKGSEIEQKIKINYRFLSF